MEGHHVEEGSDVCYRAGFSDCRVGNNQQELGRETASASPNMEGDASLLMHTHLYSSWELSSTLQSLTAHQVRSSRILHEFSNCFLSKRTGGFQERGVSLAFHETGGGTHTINGWHSLKSSLVIHSIANKSATFGDAEFPDEIVHGDFTDSGVVHKVQRAGEGDA